MYTSSHMYSIHVYLLSYYLFVTKVMHACCHVCGKLQELLWSERGSSAVLFGKSWVRLQNTALPQEIQEIPIGSILNSNV